ncbi:MAG: hypothetical protein ACRELD_08365 [Longimicrobiales bacterium]
MTSYSQAERRMLEAALARGDEPRCPVCGATVTATPVGAPPSVSYVRHRVLLVCATCGRSAALDRRAQP